MPCRPTIEAHARDHAPRCARVVASCALVALALAPTLAYAQVNELPRELVGVGVDEHLGAQVPPDAVFRDEHGNSVQLASYFGHGRPVVLDLFYDRCPMLCSLVLNAQVTALRNTVWTIGNQYDVVTISIDPSEHTSDAAPRRARLLQTYGRAGADHGWHFLTGDATSIHRVADAVGFHYHYDERQNQYAHPAVIFLLTPAGRVARYLYGITFAPEDLRIGLLEASEGRSITTVERVLLFCYHYDPQGRRYVLMATRLMQLGGLVTMVALGAFLSIMFARERHRRAAARPAGYRDTAAPGDETSQPPGREP